MPSISLADPFVNGLRPSASMPPDAPFLAQAYNCKAFRDHLLPVPSATYPAGLDLIIAFYSLTPPIQLLRGRTWWVLADATHVIRVNPATWTASNLLTSPAWSYPPGMECAQDDDWTLWIPEAGAGWTLLVGSAHHDKTASVDTDDLHMVSLITLHPSVIYDVTITGVAEADTADGFYVGVDGQDSALKNPAAGAFSYTFTVTTPTPLTNQWLWIKCTKDFHGSFLTLTVVPRPHLTPGGPWSMADFRDTFYLTNGSTAFLVWNDATLYGASPYVLLDDQAVYASCTNLRGRFIGAGLTLGTVRRSTLATISSMTLRDSATAAFWSTTGLGDAFWVHQPDVAQNGPAEAIPGGPATTGYDASNPWIREVFETNQQGWRDVGLGTLRAVHASESGAILYGQEGVGVLYPIEVPYPSLTYHRVSNIGIGGGSYYPVGVSSLQHLYLSNDTEDLCRITDPGNPLQITHERLEYSEYFNNVTLYGIYHDSLLKDFYFCCSDQTFLLSQTGLTRIRGILYFITRLAGSLTCAKDAAYATGSCLVETHPSLLGSPHGKTVTQLTLQGILQNVSVSVLYSSNGTSWSRTQPRTLAARDNVLPLLASGTLFAAKLELAVPSDLTKLNSITFSLNPTGKRNLENFFQGVTP